MRRLQKKIIALTFLLIVAAQVSLSLKFILEEFLIQQNAEKKMNTEALQSVRISKDEVIWIREGKEILLDNKLFDVKYFELTNDMLTLTGYFDAEETNLQSELKNYIETSNKENPLGEFSSEFQFPPVYNKHHFELAWDINWKSISNTYHSYVAVLPVAPCLTFTQPPKLLPSSFI